MSYGHYNPSERQSNPTYAALVKSATSGDWVVQITGSLPMPAGLALETTLVDVLNALLGTLSVSAAALPLPNGASTEITLASVLAALQGTIDVDNTTLAPNAATETTLASVLSALNAQGITLTSSDATLASILAGQPNQSTEATSLQIRDAIKAQIDLATSIWINDTGNYYLRKDVVDEVSGYQVIWTDSLGNVVATPSTTGLRPLSSTDRTITQVTYQATNAGTGYSLGDIIQHVIVVDLNNTPTTTAHVWINITTASQIAAPLVSNIEVQDENIGARQVGAWTTGRTWTLNSGTDSVTITGTIALPTGAATETTLAAIQTTINALNAKFSSLGQKAMSASAPVVIASNQSNIPVSIGNAYGTDAAGRLRVSMIENLGDYKILNSNLDTKYWATATSVSPATITTNVNSLTMAVTSGQFAILQSNQYHPYINGKTQVIQMTVIGMDAATNVEKSFGYISSNAVTPFNSTLDGFRLFKDTSNAYSIQIWRNGTQLTTTSLLRANWIDTLDGFGPSGMTINWANFNVFTFDFLWLGGTTLRCFVNYNGANILFAQYHYANSDTNTIFQSPNKPIRYEIRSTTGSGNMTAVCAAVGTEGTINKLIGKTTVKGIISGLTPLGAGIKYAICGVRKKTTARDIYAIIESFEGIINTNDFVDWEIMLNPSIAGVVGWASVAADSPFEAFQGIITNTVTNGFSLGNTYASLNMNNARDSQNILAKLGCTIANSMNEIILCATPVLTSTNVRVTGSMQVHFYQ